MSRLPLFAVLSSLSLFSLPSVTLGQDTPTTKPGATPTGRLGFDLHEGEAPSTTDSSDSSPEISPEGAALGIGVIIALCIGALVLNFLPVVIAALRGHRSTFAIFLLVLFFGWSVIGWLIALIWSFADTGRHR